MKPTYIAAVSSIILGLAFALPAGAEGQSQQSREQQQQMETGKSTNESMTGSQQGRNPSGTAEPAGNKTMSAEDITGTKIVNNAGDEIGEVEQIVRDKNTGELYAVVSVGGFLGIGDKKVAISVDDLKSQDEKLLSQLASNEEQLKAYPEYDETMYGEVADEQLVNLDQAGSGATAGVAESSFSELDTDSDGYLSKEEIRGHTEVSRQWNRIDANQDDRVDEAEFAAFELEP